MKHLAEALASGGCSYGNTEISTLQGWDLFPQGRNCESLMNTEGCGSVSLG